MAQKVFRKIVLRSNAAEYETKSNDALATMRGNKEMASNKFNVALLGSVTAAAMMAAGPVLADEPSSADVDALFAEWNRSDEPGCAVGIIQDGALSPIV